jgi:Zn-dependent protease
VCGYIGGMAISLCMYVYTDKSLCMYVCIYVCMYTQINLFNLLPIGMLDGGRVVDALHPAVGVAGLAGGGLLVYSGKNSLVFFPSFFFLCLCFFVFLSV